MRIEDLNKVYKLINTKGITSDEEAYIDRMLQLIEECDIPSVRRAMELRYAIKGRRPSWVKIAMALNSTADSVRVSVARYLATIPNINDEH